MSEKQQRPEHVIHGTVPHEEWMKFFKKHFVPSPKGGEPSEAERAKNTGSCEDYGCPHTHPISGTAITGCTVEITNGRVVSVYCHYAASAKL